MCSFTKKCNPSQDISKNVIQAFIIWCTYVVELQIRINVQSKTSKYKNRKTKFGTVKWEWMFHPVKSSKMKISTSLLPKKTVTKITQPKKTGQKNLIKVLISNWRHIHKTTYQGIFWWEVINTLASCILFILKILLRWNTKNFVTIPNFL